MAGRKRFDEEAALDAAMRLFWREGYVASVEQVTRATGLGRGSLYGTFGGKSELFRRALRRYAATYGARYDAALADHPDDPVRAVTAFLDVILDRIADPAVPDGCLIMLSAAQVASLEPDARHVVSDLLDQQRERLRVALSGSGAMHGEALDDLASFVMAINQALAVLSRAGRPAAELRATARLAIATVASAVDQGPSGERVA